MGGMDYPEDVGFPYGYAIPLMLCPFLVLLLL
jgi:hypothetical protein